MRLPKTQEGMGSGIEDRRGQGPAAGSFGVPGGMAGMGAGGLGLVGMLGMVALLVLGNCLGGSTGSQQDYGSVFGSLPQVQSAASGRLPLGDGQGQDVALYVSAVVDDVQQTWANLFQESGRRYQATRLVLYNGATRSGCGMASNDTGPFYCPIDQRVYLDLSFFEELATRSGAPGRFAEAYVIAHEFGHHVQNLLGILPKVQAAQDANPRQANALSIRLELAADCLAGIWAHSAYRQNQIDSNDIEQGLRAAAAVGDDQIQHQSMGHINPETWTHGSSQQRVTWFLNGFKSEKMQTCDTYGAAQI